MNTNKITKTDIINKAKELKEMMEEWDETHLYSDTEEISDKYSEKERDEIGDKFDDVYSAIRKMRITLNKLNK